MEERNQRERERVRKDLWRDRTTGDGLKESIANQPTNQPIVTLGNERGRQTSSNLEPHGTYDDERNKIRSLDTLLCTYIFR